MCGYLRNVYQFVDRIGNKDKSISMNQDIILLIIQFTGFMIHSNILSEDEAHSLYKLMLNQHHTNEIKSPLQEKIIMCQTWNSYMDIILIMIITI